MGKDLLIGITGGGVMHTDSSPIPSLEEQFAMVKESGVYDYFDKTPPTEEINKYIKLSEKYDLPILAGGWFYVLGRDEILLEENLKKGAALGSRVHNTQIKTKHADGHIVTNEEVEEIYLRAYEIGEKVGCYPTFEVHVNMWSEDFRRVNQVGEKIESRGIPFRMTLDHSHIIFKIDNPEEQQVFNIDQAIKTGELILDPYQKNNVCDQWIQRGYVWHCHARAAVPNNPKNIWGKHLDGTVGRGIQFPFIEPKPGEYHSDWDEKKLDSWKEVVRNLMRFASTSEKNQLQQISTEFIPQPDYGAGNKYSIFEHSVACAKWLRKTWEEIKEG